LALGIVDPKLEDQSRPLWNFGSGNPGSFQQRKESVKKPWGKKKRFKKTGRNLGKENPPKICSTRITWNPGPIPPRCANLEENSNLWAKDPGLP